MNHPEGRAARLRKLKAVPPIAAFDHRLFLDEHGRDSRLDGLTRNERRRMKAEGRKLGLAYRKILVELEHSGAGYEPDQFLRQMAIEYTNRYALSGLHNQPVSFNYFEPFCEITFIERSVAPYAVPTREVDHLFGVADYFDYITSPDTAPFDLATLLDLPEGKTFHYTPNGSLFDFTYSNANGRDFVVGGFSLIRHGQSLHWSLIGGEVFAEKTDWDALARDGLQELQSFQVNPMKAPFLAEVRARTGGGPDKPLPLDGTESAAKTILAGEIDLVSRKHLGRYLATETEDAFHVACDDPEVVVSVPKVEEIRETMRAKIEQAALMWDLAEALFQLPRYFNHKVEVVRNIAVADGKRAPSTAPKATTVAGVRYRYVSAIEFVESGSNVIRTYVAPRYAVETEGYWRRLEKGALGWNAAGQRVEGRTWVKGDHDWRARTDAPRPIYIKSSVAAAKLDQHEFLVRAASAPTVESATSPPTADELAGVVYVLRCLAMQDEIYKIGWTSGTASERASQLSSNTGVPSAFVVVDRWPHPRPEALEAAVHAMLAPYRINHGREFFRAPLQTIKAVIDTEVRRMARHR